MNARVLSWSLAGAAVVLCITLASLGMMGAGSFVWVLFALSRLVRRWL